MVVCMARLSKLAFSREILQGECMVVSIGLDNVHKKKVKWVARHPFHPLGSAPGVVPRPLSAIFIQYEEPGDEAKINK